MADITATGHPGRLAAVESDYLRAWEDHLRSGDSSDAVVARYVAIVHGVAAHFHLPPHRLTEAHLSNYLDEHSLSQRVRATYRGAMHSFSAWVRIHGATDSDRNPVLRLTAFKVLRDWAEYLSGEGYAPNTIEHRVKTIRRISQYSRVSPLKITAKHFADYLTKGDYAPRTRENYLVGMRLFCEWAEIEDITNGMRRPRIPLAVPKPVSESALSSLMEQAAVDARAYAWIVLGAYAGLRSCESASLRASDLQQSELGWVLRVVGKGKVERIVPVPSLVVDALRPHIDQLKGRGRLWPTAKAITVQNAVRRVALAVGLPCSSHQLRHRFGTATYRISKDLLLVQQLMGHSSPKFTAGYALVDLDEANDLVLRLPGAMGTPRAGDAAALHLVSTP